MRPAPNEQQTVPPFTPISLGPLTLTTPLFASIALLFSIIAISLAARRRIALPTTSRLLILLALFLMTLATASPTLDRPQDQHVLVMVDLSPSTRTARYRDPAYLQQRINQLLSNTPHRTIYFAEHDRARVESTTTDLPADLSRFNPPADASAILLFSDAQFDLPPTAPPTYIAVDPLLTSPPDSSVKDLELQATTATATIHNQSPDTRTLTWLPTGGTQQVPPGTLVLTSPASAFEITARLSSRDAWPENDTLRIHAPPPATFERWWVSTNPAPAGWRSLSPTDLPTDPAAWLAPSLIALDNLPVSSLSDAQLQRLHQYPRDLGGSLLILGGDRAFAAGAYTGTTLDALSPLSSSPPTSAIHWMLLADSSGSMAAAENNRSRWDLLQQSLRALLPRLPENDPVSIGSFAENLRWWSTAKSAAETRTLPFPTITPNGPTNLESALGTIISQSDAAMPKELLLLTDADAELANLDALRTGLAEKRIRLHLLALRDDGRALKQLEQLVRSTNGHSLRQLDPAKWTDSTKQLFQQAAPDLLIFDPTAITFLPPVNDLPERNTSPINRTWLKQSATLLAQSQRAAETIPLAARWNVGAGVVLATAFPPTTSELESLARQIEQLPRDPRFKITITPGAQLHITIDAIDNKQYLNHLPFTVDLTDLPPTTTRQSHAIPQSAPGRYELSLPAPRRPTLATIRHETRVLSRRALPARYAPEFDAIGNNLPNMRTLASRTAGQIIPPTQTTPIQFNFPPRPLQLTSWLAATSALLFAAALIRWRIR